MTYLTLTSGRNTVSTQAFRNAGGGADRSGVQRAAMVWARGANSIMDNPRVSEVGDAYGLATKFGNEFSRMLATGKEPGALDISLPSGQRVQTPQVARD